MRPHVSELLTVVQIASGDLYAGAEVQLYQLVRQLHRGGQCAVTVILMNSGILETRLRGLGVTVHVLDESRLGGTRIFFETWRILRKIRPDVVHTHRRKENVIGGVAAKLACCKVLVQTVHGLPEEHRRSVSLARRAYAWLDRLSSRLLAVAVVAVSVELASRLVFLDQSKIVIIENGIDVEALESAAAHVELPPAQASCTRIALIGRFVPVKRVDLFIEIAQELVRRFPGRFAFYVFGDGPQDGEMRLLRQRLGLENDVHFMGFKEDLASWLRLMDLVVITSDHEGLPMTLLEAMVLEVPVVSHAVGGIPEVLGHGDFGILVGQQDIAEYVAVITAALDNSQALRDRATGARRQIESRYTAAACASKYLGLYRMLSGVRGGRGLAGNRPSRTQRQSRG